MTVAAAVRMDSADEDVQQGSQRISVLDAVSMELRAGELVALTGPSGSGKTTLLSLLCGWTDPDSGSVAVGLGGGKVGDVQWSELALVPQALGLLDDLTVHENVSLPLRWIDAPPGVHGVEELLEMFGLAHLAGRIPPETSLGEQQRTALARALVCGPAIVLADEPSAHQDAAWTEEVFNVLRRIADEGAACLVATHDPHAIAVADRCCTWSPATSRAGARTGERQPRRTWLLLARTTLVRAASRRRASGRPCRGGGRRGRRSRPAAPSSTSGGRNARAMPCPSIG